MPAAWEPDSNGSPLWNSTEPEPAHGPDWGDSDDDGLPNWFEEWRGTSPGNPDSDNDGISDYDELYLTYTNPLHWDSDGDGFSDHDAWHDCWAVNHQTVGFGVVVYDWDGDGLYNHEDPFPFDPFNGGGSGVIDSDGDGVDDSYDSHPWDFTLWSDWNGNSINDHEEDPSASPGEGSGDGEGSSNGEGGEGGQGGEGGEGGGSNPIDSDGDGVPDDSDSHPWNTSLWNDHNQNGINDDQESPDPFSTDSDGDGVFDVDDSHPWNSFLWNDRNHNGINDHEETIDEPDPLTLDSDGDGLTNLREIEIGTDPYSADTDGDGLSDFHEVDPVIGYGTNPLHPDTDGDGLTDSEELMIAPTSNPLDPHSLSRAAGYGTLYTDWQMTDSTDSDGDGIPDRIEEHYYLWLDPNRPQDAGWDADGDQVTNFQAYLNGWIICATVKPFDRDGDGITDIQEDHWNTIHPGMLSKFQFGDAVQDADGDDLTNYQEIVTYNWLGLDPGNAHTHSTDRPDYLLVYWDQVVVEVAGYLNQPSVPDPNGIEWMDAWGNFSLLSLIPKPTSSNTLESWSVTGDSNNDGSPDGLTAFFNHLVSTGTPLPPPGRQSPTDYDGDGMPDVWEWRFRPQIDMWTLDGGGHPNEPLPPLVPPTFEQFADLGANAATEAFLAAVNAYSEQETQRLRSDPDGDGLSNLAEYTQGTHPFIADTDGDGINDGDELAHGSNPNSASSLPPVVLSVLSGDQQMAGHHAIVAVPVVVRATRAGKPLAGLPVQFAAADAQAVSLGTTNSGPWEPSLLLATRVDGIISFHLKAGSLTTTVTITAQAASSQVATVVLDVREPTAPILLAYLGVLSAGTPPGGDPKPESDPTEVRLMTRTRQVAIMPEYLGPPTAGAIEIQTGPHDEKKGWFVPSSVMSFNTHEDYNDFWDEFVRDDPEWGPGAYLLVDGTACEQGDLLGSGAGGGWSITLGVRVDAIGSGWWYGSSWGRGVQRDIQRLAESAFVTAAIESAGNVGSLMAVLTRFQPMLNSLAPQQTNSEQHYRELPPRAEDPFFVESHPLALGYVAKLAMHLQSAHASEMAQGITSQAKVLTGEWHECWVARGGAGLPAQEITCLRVTERTQDSQGNDLAEPEQVCLEKVVFSIPANWKYSTTTTVTTLSGTPLIPNAPPTGGNPDEGGNESNGSIFLRPSEVGVKVSLLPVEIVVRRKAESTAPDTGLLVKKGDVITFDINGAAPASAFPLPPETVKWKSRQLKHDGTTTNWTDVPGQGPELDFTTNESGVFEAKAVLTPQGGQAQDFPLTRKKDAPHADSSAGVVQDFHKAGAVDYFGVADAQWQIDVRNAALGNLGSDYYKNEGECVVQGSTTAPNPSNKCNIFIYHKCGDAGAPVPLTRGGIPGWRTGPPLAIDWWNDNSGRTDEAGRTITSFDIPNWSRLPDATMPQPGLVVAHPNLAGNPDQYSSHVGIFDYDGSWISAGFAKVNEYYHPKTSGYQPQGYRKYTGGN